MFVMSSSGLALDFANPIPTNPVFQREHRSTSHNGGYAFKIIFNEINKPLDKFLNIVYICAVVRFL